MPVMFSSVARDSAAGDNKAPDKARQCHTRTSDAYSGSKTLAGSRRGLKRVSAPSTQSLRLAHQVGERLSSHLFHHAGPMNLDSFFRNAEVGGDLLVQQP